VPLTGTHFYKAIYHLRIGKSHFMHKKALLGILLAFTVFNARAQSTYLPLNTDDNLLLDRLETRSGKLSQDLFMGSKPVYRKGAVHFIEHQKLDTNYDHLSRIDHYNMDQLLSENGEWALQGDGAFNSKHPWFRTFYKKQYDFVHVNTKDFFLVVNPVISGVALVQHNDPTVPSSATYSNPQLTNSHGAEARGLIGKKIGFYTSFTDNQEIVPYYVNNNIEKQHMAVPGADYFLITKSKGSYDYLQASGYIDFAAIKDHMNITFGSGKHFIGDGISSLFLTDYSSNMPFLEINTRVWKLNYQCLYLELTPQYDKTQGDAQYEHKYATMHYLTLNATHWLNLGFFESVVFDRPNSYEISYLNPIILTTSVNHFNGNGDKALLGFTAKAIVAKHLQFYGQFMLNEFKSSEFFSNKGWWGNKWGVQAGGKYFDAFTIKNLDLQAELDVVRPYSYTAKDTLANYTNYNQPLADPLGSGFIKAIGVARYQPAKNLSVSVKGTYYIQGVDTGGVNFGNNIFNPYTTRDQEYGVKMINGPKAHCMMMNLNISYQLRRNLFFDLGGTYRKYVNNQPITDGYTTTGPNVPLTTNYIYFGIRLNAARRDYDFF